MDVEKYELEEKIVRLIRQTRLKMPDVVRAFEQYPESLVRSTVIGLMSGPLELDGERFIAWRKSNDVPAVQGSEPVVPPLQRNRDGDPDLQLLRKGRRGLQVRAKAKPFKVKAPKPEIFWVGTKSGTICVTSSRKKDVIAWKKAFGASVWKATTTYVKDD